MIDSSGQNSPEDYAGLTTEELIERLRWEPAAQTACGWDPWGLQRLAADQLDRWINGATGEQIRQLEADLAAANREVAAEMERARTGAGEVEPEFSTETYACRVERLTRWASELDTRRAHVETQLEVAQSNLAAARTELAQRVAGHDERFAEVTDDLRLIGFGPAARDQLEQAIHRVATCGRGDPTVTVYGTNPEAPPLTGRLFGINEGGVSLVIDMGHPEAECAHVTIPTEAVRLIVIH